MQTIPTLEEEQEIARLGLAVNTTGEWLYGRRSIRKRFPHLTEWVIRRILERVRIEKTEDTLVETLMTRQAKRDRENALLGTKIVVKVPKIKPPKKVSRKNEEWMIVSDFHAPWHHVPSCEIAYQVARDLQPDKIILLGDIINLDPFSRYDKDPTGPTWVEDVASAAEIIGSFYQASPNSKIEWRRGNHEERLTKYFMRHDPLFFEHIGIESLFILSRQDKAAKALQLFEYIDENEEFFEDLRLVLKHGELVRRHSGNSVRAELDKLWMSVVMGHSHRLSVVNRSSARSRYLNEQAAFGIEAGCMCRFDIPYINESTTDWQHGFSVLSIDRSGDRAVIEPSIVPINGGRALFRGKTYIA